MIPLLVLVGPTAVGKSRLALRLAQALRGEIVGADSRQVYRYMDIGTAKPTPHERALVPHHLIDVVAPNEEFNVALYQKAAFRAIEDIHQVGKLPILVGGSGLYVRSVLRGLCIPPAPPSPELRARLEAKADNEGPLALHQELRQVDPEGADHIDLRNVRRVIRALEVWEATKVPFSSWQASKAPSFDTFTIGLTLEREELYHHIDARVDKMIKDGLVEEVASLVAMGYGYDLPPMSGLGYRQIGACLRDEVDLPTAIQQIKFSTHRYARQQYNWFRLSDPNIRWHRGGDDPNAAIMEEVSEWMAER